MEGNRMGEMVVDRVERPGYRLGVDIGGTFTDAVLAADHTGQIWTAKVLTTSEAADGALEAVDRVLTRAGLEHGDLKALLHATTLVSNLLLQRRGARTALLTTRGFEQTLLLRREVRYDSYDMTATFADPVVALEDVFGVPGRLLVDGTEFEPLDISVVRDIAAQCRDRGIASIAVSLLHSYRDPAHERVVGTVLADELGHDFPVSLSCEVNPEVREYERASTTSINAYAQPAVRRYQRLLQDNLRERGTRAPVLVMVSSGGVTTTEITSRFPVRMLESGPAAGVLAGAFYATSHGARSLVALDIGGTTAKACLIIDGRPTTHPEFEVARAKRLAKGSGLPVQIPSTDLIEVGAGGGSIAWCDSMGFLQVGPQSAEAAPGPACYGLGGTDPTVTDANLFLGLLDPATFAGGTMKLSPELAVKAMEPLAKRLGLSLGDTAAAVFETVNEAMADAVRVHLSEHGMDSSETILLASGGGGPLHAAAIARKLGVKRILIPPHPGVLSAVGLLVAPPAIDLARTYQTGIGPQTDWERVDRVMRDLEVEALSMLGGMGLARDEIVVTSSADLRWVGQTHFLTVDIPRGPYGLHSEAAIVDAYDAECRRRYGAPLRRTALEALTWRVIARGPQPPTTFKVNLPLASHRVGSTASRRVNLPGWESIEAVVYQRRDLSVDSQVRGPAVVEEDSSTCVIEPGDILTVTTDGTLAIEVLA